MNNKVSGTTPVNFVSLKNVPSGYGLVKSKQLIQRHLRKDDAVISIAYDKNGDGEILQNSVCAELRDSACKLFELG